MSDKLMINDHTESIFFSFKTTPFSPCLFLKCHHGNGESAWLEVPRWNFKDLWLIPQWICPYFTESGFCLRPPCGPGGLIDVLSFILCMMGLG